MAESGCTLVHRLIDLLKSNQISPAKALNAEAHSDIQWWCLSSNTGTVCNNLEKTTLIQLTPLLWCPLPDILPMAPEYATSHITFKKHLPMPPSEGGTGQNKSQVMLHAVKLLSTFKTQVQAKTLQSWAYTQPTFYYCPI